VTHTSLRYLTAPPIVGQMDLVCLGHQLPCSTVEGYEVVQRYVQWDLRHPSGVRGRRCAPPFVVPALV